MAFDLMFGPEFFMAEGEPYDRSDLALNSKGQPTSVWSAIEQLRTQEPATWASLAKDLFDLENPDYLGAESVFEKIQATNTCRDISTPVEVYIDPQGDYTIRVWGRE